MRKIIRSVTIIAVLSVLCLPVLECTRFTESHLICEDDFNEYTAPRPQDITDNLSV